MGKERDGKREREMGKERDGEGERGGEKEESCGVRGS